jgi:hypothetical protein
VRGLFQHLARGLRAFLVGQVELLELLAVELDQAGAEIALRMLELGLDGPVFAGPEGFDLLLALDDHAQRRALHAPGRQPALDLAPEHRGKVEADQVIERAARLLGVDELAREPARVGHRLADRLGRDLGEHHPVQGLAVEHPALLEDLADVPGNGLALAVQVGGEIDVLGGLGRPGDRLDVFLVALDHLVIHGKAVLGIDRALLGLEVAHVAVGGEDLEVLAEILVDRLRLGGRLDDEEMFGHRGFRKRVRGRRRRRAHISS